MLTKPRTVCACQFIAPMISFSVAPLERFIIAMTSAFLLLRSTFCLAFFLARATLLGVLAFVPRLAFGSEAAELACVVPFLCGRQNASDSLGGLALLGGLGLVFAPSDTGVTMLFSTESLVIGFSSTGLRS